MPIAGFPDRPIIRQRWFTPPAITIGTVATPLVADPSLWQAMPIAFAISVPQAAANNIFIGNAGVGLATGLEIVAGSGPIAFPVGNWAQRYELQDPMIKIARHFQCEGQDPVTIPFMVWDLSQVFGIAAANTAIGCAYWLAEFV